MTSLGSRQSHGSHSTSTSPRITTLDAGPTWFRPSDDGTYSTDRTTVPPRSVRLRRPAASQPDMLPVHHKSDQPIRTPTLHLRSRSCFRLVAALAATFALYWYLIDGSPHGPSAPYPYTSKPTPYGLNEEIPLPQIHPAHLQTPPPAANIIPTPTTSVWLERAQAVRAGFMHALRSYKAYSFPHDELLPLSRQYQDNFNGWGVTLIDSLDTMHLMGLHEEFNQSMSHVAKINLAIYQDIPFFETIIRYLGGLISAYHMSSNPILLARADELGRKLLPAFNTTSGLPAYAVNMKTGETSDGWQGSTVILAEIASFQVEFRALAHLTGRAEYVEVGDRVMDHLSRMETDGLYPMGYNKLDGNVSDTSFSVGASADSAYEYFLKQWLLSNRTETRWRDMYVESASSIIKNLLFLSPERGLLYVTDTKAAGYPTGTFEHLSCFMGGLLALGYATIPGLPQTHLWAAEGLTHTCWITYADNESGLGADEVVFPQPTEENLWMTYVDEWVEGGRVGAPPGTGQASPVRSGESTEYWIRREDHLLRPETVESFYILWRTTKDVRWRERGWAVFEALERHARQAVGYACIINVTSPAAQVMPKDEMPSFFMAETLKYLYLLFVDEDLVPLNKFVFNTEAHPIPVFEWQQWEKDLFRIRA